MSDHTALTLITAGMLCLSDTQIVVNVLLLVAAVFVGALPQLT